MPAPADRLAADTSRPTSDEGGLRTSDMRQSSSCRLTGQEVEPSARGRPSRPGRPFAWRRAMSTRAGSQVGDVSGTGCDCNRAAPGKAALRHHVVGPGRQVLPRRRQHHCAKGWRSPLQGRLLFAFRRNLAPPKEVPALVIVVLDGHTVGGGLDVATASSLTLSAVAVLS